MRALSCRHWPIGLLYDLHHLASESALWPARPVTIPSSLASVFAPLTGPDAASRRSSAGRSDGPDLSLSVGGSSDARGGRQPRMGGSVGSLRAPAASASGGATPRQRTPSSSTTGTSRSAATASSAAAATAPAMNRAASASSSSATSASSSSFRHSSSTFAAPPLTASDPLTGHATSTAAATKAAGKVGPAVQPWRIVVRYRCASGAGPATAAAGGGADTGGGGGGGGVLLSGGHRVDEIRTGFMAMIKVRSQRHAGLPLRNSAFFLGRGH